MPCRHRHGRHGRQHEHIPAVTRADVTSTVEAAALRQRVDQLERRSDIRDEVQRQLAGQPRRAIDAQQVHVHGLALADVIAARQREERAAITSAELPAIGGRI